MLDSSNLVTFDGVANSSSYDAFLLDEERGRLLVGAEDHIFSFDLVNINRDQKQVQVISELSASITPALSSLRPAPAAQMGLSVIPLQHLD